ncbi:hypothetical protein ABIB62_003285 [Mucilaginibacter sp. UYP25]|uniref:BLUF domain-containing protein n=1 Tax=unclassified Mucilaginibacter TaxID=2617802 RepID=UPI003391A0A5
MPLLCVTLFNKRCPKAIYSQRVIRFVKGRQDNNTRVGTTGLLLYCDGAFMQFRRIRRPLAQGYRRIEIDKRYSYVLKIAEGVSIKRRIFPDWATAFDRRKDVDFAKVKPL